MSGRPASFSDYPYEKWMAKGACRNKDFDIFFPPDGHNLLSRQAIEICNTCLVQMDCLSYALDHVILDGVWGGTTRNERRRILKNRRALRLAIDPTPPPSSEDG